MALYAIYYGTVRAIMEPLRDEKFNMGSNGNISVILSICFIIVGVAGLIATRIINKNRNFENLYVNYNYVESNQEKEDEKHKIELIEAKKEEIRKKRNQKE